MEKTAPPLVPFAGPGARTLRLTFAYEGEKVDLVAQQSIDMIAPAQATTPPQQGQSGFWYEVRDTEDRALYAGVLHNPLRSVVEGYSKETRALHPREVTSPKGLFVVLVPEIVEAASVVLFSSPPESRAAGQAAREIARFLLARSPRENGNQP